MKFILIQTALQHHGFYKMAGFSVNTDKALELTAKLEKMHKSDFPLAVRGTLNDAAAFARLKAIDNANTTFTRRSKNLWKAYIVFHKSKNTFDVNDMASTIGIDNSKPKRTKIAEGLAKQETGGTVVGRKIIPVDTGRITGAYGRRLQTKYRFEKIKIASANRKKRGSKIMAIKSKGKEIIFDTSKTIWKAIYVKRASNLSKLKKRKPFIRPAVRTTRLEMGRLYKENFDRRVLRALKRK